MNTNVKILSVVTALLCCIANPSTADVLDLSATVDESCTWTNTSGLTWPLEQFATKVSGGQAFATHTVGAVNCSAVGIQIRVASSKGGLKNGEGVCGPASSTCVHYVATANATWAGTSPITSVVHAQGDGVLGNSSNAFGGGGDATITLDMTPDVNQQTLMEGTLTDTIFVRIGSNL